MFIDLETILLYFMYIDTIDIYVDRKGRVWIVDVNPFGEPTCPLLFDWLEFSSLPELESQSMFICQQTLVNSWIFANNKWKSQIVKMRDRLNNNFKCAIA